MNGMQLVLDIHVDSCLSFPLNLAKMIEWFALVWLDELFVNGLIALGIVCFAYPPIGSMYLKWCRMQDRSARLQSLTIRECKLHLVQEPCGKLQGYKALISKFQICLRARQCT